MSRQRHALLNALVTLGLIPAVRAASPADDRAWLIEAFDAMAGPVVRAAATRPADNESGGIAWGTSYELAGLAEMLAVTRDAKYARMFVRVADPVCAGTDQARGLRDEIRGGVLPAWGSSRYSGGKRYVWAVHTGMIAEPLARFAGVVRSEPALKAVFGAKADAYLAVARKAAAVHDSDFVEGPREGEGHLLIQYSNQIAPLNMQNALGRAWLRIDDATGTTEHRERVVKLARFFRNRLRTTEDGASAWEYRPPLDSAGTGFEDISHAAINVDFLVLCREHGLVFTDEDIRRVEKTLLTRVFRPDGSLADNVGGTGGVNRHRAQVLRWAALARHSVAARERLIAFRRDGHGGQGGTDLLGCALLVAACATPPATRPAAADDDSAFYPAAVAARARENAAKHSWAAEARQRIVAAAEPWLKFADDQLWSLMFGHTITRSWMVWSNGHCPACARPVPMYNWVIDALNRPWKVQCPHCRELFPTNDFARFYRSGLDEHGVFDPKRADRSLLFNAAHPDPADPRHTFGVDDGEGYVAGPNRWRFIGAYLVYGQWKQAIVAGIENLAAAYVLTGERAYAHKAAVLLDRVADLYPTFDFAAQAVVYEIPQGSGYVSIWHDACVETRRIALAYDQIRPGLRDDAELVAFLGRKAREFRLERPKDSVAAIRRNIEDRILRDAIASRRKIESNYPQTDVTIALMKTILGGEAAGAEVNGIIDAVLMKSTAVDGLTGEKGLDGYAAYALSGVADLLGRYARRDPAFLPDALARHPRLRDMFRFHLDTWCLQRYYPTCGDAGAFAARHESYAGGRFSRSPGLDPSTFTLFWKLYQATGERAFAQVMYLSNGRSVEGLPHDLFADDPAAVQRGVREVIDRDGETIPVGSVNKQQWCLAILRGGRGEHARALWLDYDSGGRHAHADGMNLGLYALGLDLMPDFGYPPVQYGGWTSPRARWYTMTAAHNTVVVDGADLKPASGKTTLWVEGAFLRAVRASAPGLIGGRQYERTAVMVDTGEEGFYVI
ncbi:MAG: heparinase II/III family protein, partial [Phycisphaerae bacterium]